MKVSVALALFFVAIITDVVWACYTSHVAGKRAVHAAAFAALIVLVGVVSIRAYIDTPLYALPAAAGAAVGTFLAVRKDKS